MRDEPIVHIVVSEQGAVTDDMRIEGVEALLGSASHCHLRISPDKVAPEQLRFEVRDGVLFASVIASKHAVALNGRTFSGGRLQAGDVLTLGNLTVKAELDRSAHRSDHRSSARPRPIHLAIAGVSLVALVLLFMPRRDGSLREAPQAPALFSAAAEPCPESSPAGARAAASEFERIAVAKRERAPFLPEEGLTAVRSYRRAATCWDASGDQAAAQRAGARAVALQTSVERDYHMHQVRVYLAQRSHDAPLLAREAKVLASYVKGRSDRYVDWLDQLQRELEATPKGEKNK